MNGANKIIHIFKDMENVDIILVKSKGLVKDYTKIFDNID
ncbi:hypothetical protein HNR33_000573 [Brassicibacter mesophilus]